MGEIQIGDRVATASSAGSVTFSEIRTFLKKQPTVTNMYQSLKTSRNKTITLSGDHIIYAKQSGANNFIPIYGVKVSIGDEVLVEENAKLIPAKVVNVSSFMMQGAYTPITMEGRILVDGILASCYASVDHDLAHIVMKPIQWFPTAIEWIFGVINAERNGTPPYVMINEKIGRFLIPQQQTYAVNLSMFQV